METKPFDEMFCLENTHWWFITRRTIIQKLLKHFLSQHNDPKILEIGCGTRGNLALLNDFGNVYATELDVYARSLANTRDFIQIKKGILPDDIPLSTTI